MKREIKFRAWDSFRRKMIDTGYHVIGEVTMFGIIDQWVQQHRGDTPSLEYYNNIIESQFTGLQDKNGKEIYEGDIIKYSYSRDTSGKDIVEFIETIVWENDMEWSGFNIHKTMNHEIIGNIYENPQLLNSEQNDAECDTTDDDSNSIAG